MSEPLASAFSLWGLVAVTRIEPEQRRHSWILIAAACFALAMATKLTSLFGISASILWLLSQRRFRVAVQLGFFYALFVLALAFLFQFLSQGRMFGVISACAAGGGDAASLLQAPIIFSGELCRFDPGAAGFAVLAVTTIAVGRQFKSLPALLLLMTTLGTLAIYASPGTDINHLIDLQLASVLCVAVALHRQSSGRWVVATAAVALSLAAAVSCLTEVSKIDREARKEHLAAVMAMVQNQGPGPLLSDDPLLPLLAGERPYLGDSFMFRALTERDPALGKQFWNALAAREFRAVVLSPLGGPEALRLPRTFDGEVIDRVLDGYVLVTREGRYFVYRRRESK